MLEQRSRYALKQHGISARSSLTKNSSSRPGGSPETLTFRPLTRASNGVAYVQEGDGPLGAPELARKASPGMPCSWSHGARFCNVKHAGEATGIILDKESHKPALASLAVAATRLDSILHLKDYSVAFGAGTPHLWLDPHA